MMQIESLNKQWSVDIDLILNDRSDNKKSAKDCDNTGGYNGNGVEGNDDVKEEMKEKKEAEGEEKDNGKWLNRP